MRSASAAFSTAGLQVAPLVAGTLSRIDSASSSRSSRRSRTCQYSEAALTFSRSARARMDSASSPSSWTKRRAAETRPARLNPFILLAILTLLGIPLALRGPNAVRAIRKEHEMQATETRRWRFKGPEMEGPVARWYARIRGTRSQIEVYRKQAAELTAGLADGAAVLEV